MPFSENASAEMGPVCPGKSATFFRSFMSQILIIESSVPVPNISPSGWNCTLVKPVGFCCDSSPPELVTLTLHSSFPVRMSNSDQYCLISF